MVYQTNDQKVSLKQILERSKLQASKISQQDLPPIERGLEQIDSQTKKLSSKTIQKDDNVDIRAHYFLAQSGVNTQVLMRELGTIHLGVPIEQRQPIQDTDVDGYFYQRRTHTIIDLIQSEKQEIIRDSETAFEQDLQSTWAKDQTTIYQSIMPTEKPSAANMDISKLKLDLSKVVGADFSSTVVV
ncbi:uncharacterized protein BX664DRAFT_96604 [Halteromyces radiatus]|uniref:uncharacterized protein n=1 Tax=Halteromyces radiatus TaxID=101107 RepID=UPI0022210565|nr:uncharacterized protein BX664DRAFT_96604 [Halteromyces radiatus]KAI8092889.1 hypothetical protein BX664DRAFT_96604 [Halteromyces radiatus]